MIDLVPFVYMLQCSDGSLYVGSTWSIENRVDQHNTGQVEGWTSTRRPVTLLWYAEYERMDEAAVMERRIKGWRRAKKLALAEGRFADLPKLSGRGAGADLRHEVSES